MDTTVSAYLEEKAETPREWLRREPHETHPEILKLVRDAIGDGLHYDLDVLERVRETADLATGPLVAQLAHEVYIARGVIRDQEADAALEALKANGYERFGDRGLEPGTRCTLRVGTVYVGRRVADYGRPIQVRAKRKPGGGIGFVRKGHQNFDPSLTVNGDTLVLAGWDA